jgi:hypothetical protein
VVTPVNPTNVVGATQPFTATGTYSDGTTQNITGQVAWTSSNPAVATISTSDLAVSMSGGATTISALLGGVTGVTGGTTLTVIAPPSITAQPLGQQVLLGCCVSFSASVSGTAPLSYLWCLNGACITNATNATFTIQAAGISDTGNYSVVVTNLAGSMNSSNAFLTVIAPPTLALYLSPGYPLLNLNGMLSSNFIVQYSSNLAGTNWTDLVSVTNLSASPYLFLDPSGAPEPARFYRAFMR